MNYNRLKQIEEKINELIEDNEKISCTVEFVLSQEYLKINAIFIRTRENNSDQVLGTIWAKDNFTVEKRYSTRKQFNDYGDIDTKKEGTSETIREYLLNHIQAADFML